MLEIEKSDAPNPIETHDTPTQFFPSLTNNRKEALKWVHRANDQHHDNDDVWINELFPTSTQKGDTEADGDDQPGEELVVFDHSTNKTESNNGGGEMVVFTHTPPPPLFGTAHTGTDDADCNNDTDEDDDDRRTPTL